MVDSSTGPTHGKKKRKARQRKRMQYQILREELQLSGDIPTTPEGAIRDERVDPRSQEDSPLPALVRQALRESWATPDAAKPAIIAALLAPFYAEDTVIDPITMMPVKIKAPAKLLNEIARTLRQLDQTQYERDHPEAAGKARGGGGAPGSPVNVNIQLATIIRGMVESGELGVFEELQAPSQPDAPGSAAHQRQVEAGATPADAEQRAGESMEIS